MLRQQQKGELFLHSSLPSRHDSLSFKTSTRIYVAQGWSSGPQAACKIMERVSISCVRLFKLALLVLNPTNRTSPAPHLLTVDPIIRPSRGVSVVRQFPQLFCLSSFPVKLHRLCCLHVARLSPCGLCRARGSLTGTSMALGATTRLRRSTAPARATGECKARSEWAGRH